MNFNKDRDCWKCKHCDLESAAHVNVAICRRAENTGLGRVDLCEAERSWSFPLDWFTKSCGKQGRYFESIIQFDLNLMEDYNERKQTREQEPQE